MAGSVAAAVSMTPQDHLTPEIASALGEFARTARAAARAVSLYPPTHPSIQGSVGRVVAAAAQLTATGEVTLGIQPGVIALDNRVPAKPEASIAELADLLHERRVGTLTIQPGSALTDWLALLLVLARTPDDLYADGGIARAWAATGGSRFEIREIDYAEVLRERSGGESAAWDRIVAFCLHGESGTIDDSTLGKVLDLVDNPEKFGSLVDRLETTGATASLGGRAVALLKLLETVARAADVRNPDDHTQFLQTASTAISRLTPDMLLALMTQAREGTKEERDLVDGMIRQATDDSIASFVASSVISERGASERLAQAFEALVPELERKERLLDAVHDEVAAAPLGQDAGFEELWKNAADMLTSYSDRSFVSSEYARELSGARTQALEIERVSDDPPERVQDWLATVSDTAIGDLDTWLLEDLLRIETDAAPWQEVARIAVAEVERRTVLGEAARVAPLLDAVVKERGDDGRPELRQPATEAVDSLARGPLVRHVVIQLRKNEDRAIEPLSRLCHAIGPALVRPLAEALAIEENARAIRRLREILLGFGAAGRQSVEQLKSSSNPAVRRTAIDLLRVFGGREALPELASMLDDADPQVQRESIRAIVQIGTPDAFAILERRLLAGGSSREVILRELVTLRDNKTIPLLCQALNRTRARGLMVQMHRDIIDTLGALSPHPSSTAALRDALYRGAWWTPARTAMLRSAAASALRRLGSTEALAVLEEALAKGTRGVRNAVRPHAGPLRRERIEA